MDNEASFEMSGLAEELKKIQNSSPGSPAGETGVQGDDSTLKPLFSDEPFVDEPVESSQSPLAGPVAGPQAAVEAVTQGRRGLGETLRGFGRSFRGLFERARTQARREARVIQEHAARREPASAQTRDAEPAQLLSEDIRITGYSDEELVGLMGSDLEVRARREDVKKGMREVQDINEEESELMLNKAIRGAEARLRGEQTASVEEQKQEEKAEAQSPVKKRRLKLREGRTLKEKLEAMQKEQHEKEIKVYRQTKGVKEGAKEFAEIYGAGLVSGTALGFGTGFILGTSGVLSGGAVPLTVLGASFARNLAGRAAEWKHAAHRATRSHHDTSSSSNVLVLGGLSELGKKWLTGERKLIESLTDIRIDKDGFAAKVIKASLNENGIIDPVKISAVADVVREAVLESVQREGQSSEVVLKYLINEGAKLALANQLSGGLSVQKSVEGLNLRKIDEKNLDYEGYAAGLQIVLKEVDAMTLAAIEAVAPEGSDQWNSLVGYWINSRRFTGEKVLRGTAYAFGGAVLGTAKTGAMMLGGGLAGDLLSQAPAIGEKVRELRNLGRGILEGVVQKITGSSMQTVGQAEIDGRGAVGSKVQSPAPAAKGLGEQINEMIEKIKKDGLGALRERQMTEDVIPPIAEARMNQLNAVKQALAGNSQAQEVLDHYQAPADQQELLGRLPPDFSTMEPANQIKKLAEIDFALVSAKAAALAAAVSPENAAKYQEIYYLGMEVNPGKFREALQYVIDHEGDLQGGFPPPEAVLGTADPAEQFARLAQYYYPNLYGLPQDQKTALVNKLANFSGANFGDFWNLPAAEKVFKIKMAWDAVTQQVAPPEGPPPAPNLGSAAGAVKEISLELKIPKGSTAGQAVLEAIKAPETQKALRAAGVDPAKINLWDKTGVWIWENGLPGKGGDTEQWKYYYKMASTMAKQGKGEALKAFQEWGFDPDKGLFDDAKVSPLLAEAKAGNSKALHQLHELYHWRPADQAEKVIFKLPGAGTAVDAAAQTSKPAVSEIQEIQRAVEQIKAPPKEMKKLVSEAILNHNQPPGAPPLTPNVPAFIPEVIRYGAREVPVAPGVLNAVNKTLSYLSQPDFFSSLDASTGAFVKSLLTYPSGGQALPSGQVTEPVKRLAVFFSEGLRDSARFYSPDFHSLLNAVVNVSSEKELAEIVQAISEKGSYNGVKYSREQIEALLKFVYAEGLLKDDQSGIKDYWVLKKTLELSVGSP